MKVPVPVMRANDIAPPPVAPHVLAARCGRVADLFNPRPI